MQQRKKWELANEKNKRAVSKYKAKYQIYQYYHSVYGDSNRGVSRVLFYVMEQNAVQENMDYMEYTMQRNEDGIKTKIDSINMSTQFFLSDDSLLQMLNASAIGRNLYGKLAGF